MEDYITNEEASVFKRPVYNGIAAAPPVQDDADVGVSDKRGTPRQSPHNENLQPGQLEHRKPKLEDYITKEKATVFERPVSNDIAADQPVQDDADVGVGDKRGIPRQSPHNEYLQPGQLEHRKPKLEDYITNKEATVSKRPVSNDITADLPVQDDADVGVGDKRGIPRQSPHNGYLRPGHLEDRKPKLEDYIPNEEATGFKTPVSNDHSKEFAEKNMDDTSSDVKPYHRNTAGGNEANNETADHQAITSKAPPQTKVDHDKESLLPELDSIRTNISKILDILSRDPTRTQTEVIETTTETTTVQDTRSTVTQVTQALVSTHDAHTTGEETGIDGTSIAKLANMSSVLLEKSSKHLSKSFDDFRKQSTSNRNHMKKMLAAVGNLKVLNEKLKESNSNDTTQPAGHVGNSARQRSIRSIVGYPSKVEDKSEDIPSGTSKDNVMMASGNQSHLKSVVPVEKLQQEFWGIWNEFGLDDENQLDSMVKSHGRNRTGSIGHKSSQESDEIEISADNNVQTKVMTILNPEPGVLMRKDVSIVHQTAQSPVVKTDIMTIVTPEPGVALRKDVVVVYPTTQDKLNIEKEEDQLDAVKTDIMTIVTPEPGVALRKDVVVVYPTTQDSLNIENEKDQLDAVKTDIMTIVTPEPGVALRKDVVVVYPTTQDKLNIENEEDQLDAVKTDIMTIVTPEPGVALRKDVVVVYPTTQDSFNIENEKDQLDAVKTDIMTIVTPEPGVALRKDVVVVYPTTQDKLNIENEEDQLDAVKTDIMTIVTPEPGVALRKDVVVVYPTTQDSFNIENEKDQLDAVKTDIMTIVTPEPGVALRKDVIVVYPTTQDKLNIENEEDQLDAVKTDIMTIVTPEPGVALRKDVVVVYPTTQDSFNIENEKDQLDAVKTDIMTIVTPEPGVALRKDVVVVYPTTQDKLNIENEKDQLDAVKTDIMTIVTPEPGVALRKDVVVVYPTTQDIFNTKNGEDQLNAVKTDIMTIVTPEPGVALRKDIMVVHPTTQKLAITETVEDQLDAVETIINLSIVTPEPEVVPTIYMNIELQDILISDTNRDYQELSPDKMMPVDQKVKTEIMTIITPEDGVALRKDLLLIQATSPTPIPEVVTEYEPLEHREPSDFNIFPVVDDIADQYQKPPSSQEHQASNHVDENRPILSFSNEHSRIDTAFDYHLSGPFMKTPLYTTTAQTVNIVDEIDEAMDEVLDQINISPDSKISPTPESINRSSEFGSEWLDFYKNPFPTKPGSLAATAKLESLAELHVLVDEAETNSSFNGNIQQKGHKTINVSITGNIKAANVDFLSQILDLLRYSKATGKGGKTLLTNAYGGHLTLVQHGNSGISVGDSTVEVDGVRFNVTSVKQGSTDTQNQHDPSGASDINVHIDENDGYQVSIHKEASGLPTDKVKNYSFRNYGGRMLEARDENEMSPWDNINDFQGNGDDESFMGRPVHRSADKPHPSRFMRQILPAAYRRRRRQNLDNGVQQLPINQILMSSVWSSWGDWAPCSVSCGRGLVTRQRACVLAQSKEPCVGRNKAFDECVVDACLEGKTMFLEWYKFLPK